VIGIVIEIGFGLWMLGMVLGFFGLDEVLLELAKGADALLRGRSKGRHLRQERRALALMERKKFAEAAVIYRGLMKHRMGVGDSLGAVRDAQLAIRAYERAGSGEFTDDILISLESHLEAVAALSIARGEAKARGDLRTAGDVAVSLGTALRELGRHEKAADVFDDAMQSYESSGSQAAPVPIDLSDGGVAAADADGNAEGERSKVT